MGLMRSVGTFQRSPRAENSSALRSVFLCDYVQSWVGITDYRNPRTHLHRTSRGQGVGWDRVGVREPICSTSTATATEWVWDHIEIRELIAHRTLVVPSGRHVRSDGHK